MKFGQEEDEFFSTNFDTGIGTVEVVAFIEKSNLRGQLLSLVETSQAFGVSVRSHQEFSPAAVDKANIIIVEARLIEAFADFKLVRTIRLHRPLVPIVILCDNPDTEFVLAGFSSGANDYISYDTSNEVLAARITSLTRLGAPIALIELQNKELVTSMRSLREAQGSH